MAENVAELETAPITEPVAELPPDVDALIKAAQEATRAEEKQKLYARLTKEQEKAKQAEEDAKAVKAQLRELEEFKNRVELEKLSETEKLQKLLQQAHERAEHEAQLRAEKEAELAERIRLMDLSIFRNQLIKDSELDPDLHDLVKGETEEALKESLDSAKNKEAKLREKFGAKVESTPEPRSTPSARPSSPYPNLLPGRSSNPDEWKTREDLEKRKREMGLK